MKWVRVQRLKTLKDTHPEVIGFLNPVDNVKYANSAVNQLLEVPDSVGGVYVSRGRDNTGNYYKFLWLPAILPNQKGL